MARNIYYVGLLTLLLCKSHTIFAANCFEYTDLYADNVICQYGDFYNPYSRTGVINGRHTIMTNKTAKDRNTNNKLSIVPIGEDMSVRLGNEYTGAQAEAITYIIDVDTLNFQLLYLKYAVVLENPNHSKQEQPRFTLEILDKNGKLISPDCGYADYYAGWGSGWNYYSDITWKDWSINGFDLTQYHGQRIRVRLTTYDCEQSGHFGYAYFTLTCGEKLMKVFACKDASDAKLEAPVGYNYEWYKSGISQIISQEQSVNVAVDGSFYTCICKAIHNSNCKFTVSATSDPRFPKSEFDLISSQGECVLNVSSVNKSGVYDKNGKSIITPDSFKWLLPDGTSSIDKELNADLTESGTQRIGLVTLTNDETCSDTLYKTIAVPEMKEYYDSVSAQICNGDKYHYNGKDYDISGVFKENLKSIYGCDSVEVLNLKVNPVYSYPSYAAVCDGESIEFRGRFINQAGTYYDSLKTVYGCDSIYSVTLNINPKYLIEQKDILCEGSHYNFRGRDIIEPGIYYDSLVSSYNCDSVFVLELAGSPVFRNEITEHICKGEHFIFGNNTYDKPGVYVDSLKSVYGCDSVCVLNLKVHEVIISDVLTKELDDKIEITVIHNQEYPPYTFDLDGDVFFSNVSYVTTIGQHNLKVSDANNCEKNFTFLTNMELHPDVFFTPNDDAINDRWEIKNIQFYPDATISIYDKFGRMVASYHGYDDGWDGTYNNRSLPPDDYWYVIKGGNLYKTYSGHFVLKR